MTTLKYDDDFPIQFCPVCGSEHLTGGAIHDEVLGFDRWNQYCNTCHWKFEIFILKKGKTVFKFRSDSDNCKECNYESGGKVQKKESIFHSLRSHLFTWCGKKITEVEFSTDRFEIVNCPECREARTGLPKPDSERKIDPCIRCGKNGHRCPYAFCIHPSRRPKPSGGSSLVSESMRSNTSTRAKEASPSKEPNPENKRGKKT